MGVERQPCRSGTCAALHPLRAAAFGRSALCKKGHNRHYRTKQTAIHTYVRILNSARTEAVSALAADRSNIRMCVERVAGGHRTAHEEIAQVRHRAHLRPPLAQQSLRDHTFCEQRRGHRQSDTDADTDAGTDVRECGGAFARRGMQLLRRRAVALLNELTQLVHLHCIYKLQVHL